MTEPRFKVGDRVYIPKDKPVTDDPREVPGTVIEIYPSTPGARSVGPEERIGWSTGTAYLIDFGLSHGRRRIEQHLLEPEPN